YLSWGSPDQNVSFTTVRHYLDKSVAPFPLWAQAVVAPRNPMVGSFPGCCARAAIGHAAAGPPSSVMNSRRFIPAINRYLIGPALRGTGVKETLDRDYRVSLP